MRRTRCRWWPMRGRVVFGIGNKPTNGVLWITDTSQSSSITETLEEHKIVSNLIDRWVPFNSNLFLIDNGHLSLLYKKLARNKDSDKITRDKSNNRAKGKRKGTEDD